MNAIQNDLPALSIYMQTIDIPGFTSILKNSIVPLSSLQEPGGYNIFHNIADCFVKESYLLEYLEILISEFHDRYFEEANDMIKQMLNQPGGREKQTPLMCAAKHNRRRLLKELISLGGDFWLKDINWHNLVHISASNGHESILVYLCFTLKMSYIEKDINQRSPLHLACLENQVGTGMLLIAWNEELDEQDAEGFSPLHLAVLSQSYKLVRNLIIMSANKKVKDNKGEIPLDLALNRGDNSIVKLLEPLSCSQRINPFRQSVGPVKNGYIRLMLYLLFSLFRAAVISTIVLPRMTFFLAAPSVGLFFIALVGFIVASCKDPGYTRNDKKVELAEFYELYRSDYICVYCETRKPKHARHCHYCKKCVKEFDHHCPWIHNCVGKNNHFWFMIFITFSILDYSCQIALGVMDYLGIFRKVDKYFYALPEESKFMSLAAAGLSGIFLIFVLPVWAIQIMNCCKSGIKRRTESKTLVRPNSATIGEFSDTGSMFLVASSEWNPASYQNSILLNKKNKAVEDAGCCYTRRNEDSMGVSLKKK